MKQVLLPALLLGATTLTLSADISMPVKDSFYDKLGRGLANTTLGFTEPLDSQYSMLETEGNTKAFFKGLLVQGISRMVMDMGHGVFEIITAPFPLNDHCSYRTFKCPPYDSMVVNDYPPSDLKHWY